MLCTLLALLAVCMQLLTFWTSPEQSLPRRVLHPRETLLCWSLQGKGRSDRNQRKARRCGESLGPGSLIEARWISPPCTWGTLAENLRPPKADRSLHTLISTAHNIGTVVWATEADCTVEPVAKRYRCHPVSGNTGKLASPSPSSGTWKLSLSTPEIGWHPRLVVYCSTSPLCTCRSGSAHFHL